MSVIEAIAKRVQAAAISTEEKAQLLGLLIIKPDLWEACLMLEEEDQLIARLRALCHENRGMTAAVCSCVYHFDVLLHTTEQDVLSAHERAWTRVFDAPKELAGHVGPSEAPAPAKRIKSELTNECQFNNNPLSCLHAVGAVRGIVYLWTAPIALLHGISRRPITYLLRCVDWTASRSPSMLVEQLIGPLPDGRPAVGRQW